MYTPPVESYPVSEVQKNSATLLGRVALHRQIVVLTYHDRLDESVILVHPDLWHELCAKFPVEGDKILPPVGVKKAREDFAALREDAVYNGCHTMITHRGREHVAVVPLPWARKALPDVQRWYEAP
jgi:hypothetical protein